MLGRCLPEGPFSAPGQFPPSSVPVNPSLSLPAPSQPPGNVVWNATDARVFLSWEQVRAMENESEVTGYKVSGGVCWGLGSHQGFPGSWDPFPP